MHENLITVMDLKEICIAIDSEFYEARELPLVVFGRPLPFTIFNLFHSSIILLVSKTRLCHSHWLQSAHGLRSNSLF